MVVVKASSLSTGEKYYQVRIHFCDIHVPLTPPPLSQLVVIFGVIQGIIFSITISHSGGNILIRTYDGIAWENFLLALESLPLAWILAWSFPASELEYHPLPTYTDPRLKDSTRAEDAMTLSTV